MPRSSRSSRTTPLLACLLPPPLPLLLLAPALGLRLGLSPAASPNGAAPLLLAALLCAAALARGRAPCSVGCVCLRVAHLHRAPLGSAVVTRVPAAWSAAAGRAGRKRMGALAHQTLDELNSFEQRSTLRSTGSAPRLPRWVAPMQCAHRLGLGERWRAGAAADTLRDLACECPPLPPLAHPPPAPKSSAAPLPFCISTGWRAAHTLTLGRWRLLSCCCVSPKLRATKNSLPREPLSRALHFHSYAGRCPLLPSTCPTQVRWVALWGPPTAEQSQLRAPLASR